MTEGNGQHMVSLMDWLTKIIPTIGTVLVALFSYWTSKQKSDHEQQQDERKMLLDDLEKQRARNDKLEKQHDEDLDQITKLKSDLASKQYELIKLENELGVKHTSTDASDYDDEV